MTETGIPTSGGFWAGVGALATAALGGLGVAIKAWLGRKGEAASVSNTEARSESISVRTLQRVVDTLAERVDDCEKDRKGLHDALKDAIERIERLESILAVYERRLTANGLKTTMEGT